MKCSDLEQTTVLPLFAIEIKSKKVYSKIRSIVGCAFCWKKFTVKTVQKRNMRFLWMMC